MFFYTLILLVLNVLTSSACPDGFESHVDSCYAILPVKASWAEAKTYCSVIGADLAVIGSKSESDFIHGYLLREHSTISTSQVWIGGTDLLQEGVWRTPDNSEVLSFLNWAPSEPDNLGGQHCLAIFNAGALQWDDNTCEVHNFALCKISNFNGESIIG